MHSNKKKMREKREIKVEFYISPVRRTRMRAHKLFPSIARPALHKTYHHRPSLLAVSSQWLIDHGSRIGVLSFSAT